MRMHSYQNAFEWREMLQGHLVLRGNAYNRIVSNARSEITQLNPTPLGVQHRHRVAVRDRHHPAPQLGRVDAGGKAQREEQEGSHIANRLQAAMTNEILFLIDNGYATPIQLDVAIKGRISFRMPILDIAKKIDFSDVEQIQRVVRNSRYHAPPYRQNSETMDRLVFVGKVGVKSGRRFFDYGDPSPEEIMHEANLKLIKLRAFLKGLGEL